MTHVKPEERNEYLKICHNQMIENYVGCEYDGYGYVMECLKSSLRKFYKNKTNHHYVRYGVLVKHYEVSLSQMLHDILGHDHLQ